MPTSLLALAPEVLSMVWEIQPKRVLDIGCGWGKYGLLLRENFSRDFFQKLDCIEVEDSYHQGRQGEILYAVYDQVWRRNASDMDLTFYSEYDLVLMIDVIEHLEKEDGIALLEKINCKIIISTPVEFFQTDEGLPESEKHKSLWTIEDFGDRVIKDNSQKGAVLVTLC
jgi:2-polyprenyl-3-methyl-5-hydroxy-6-metoxy-1,4-benzoquinol methylase